MTWTRPERTWRDALLAALLPRLGPPGELPGVGDLDLSDFWRQFEHTSPWLLRVGLRAAVWLLTWSPPLHGCGWRPLHRMPDGLRDAYLRQLARADGYLTRQCLATVKIVTSFAYFQDESVRRLVDRSPP